MAAEAKTIKLEFNFFAIVFLYYFLVQICVWKFSLNDLFNLIFILFSSSKLCLSIFLCFAVQLL